MRFKLRLIFALIVGICFAHTSLTFCQQKTIDSLKIEFHQVNNDSLRVRVLGDLAYFYSSINADSCFYYAEKTYQLAESNNYLRGMINGRYKMAMAYQSLGEYDQAEAMALDVLNLSIEKNDTFRMTLGLNLLGVIQSQAGDATKAIESLFKSAELSNISGDEINSAYAYSNIGEIYQGGNDFENAQKYFLRALKIWQTLTDSFELVTIYNNMSGVTKDTVQKLNYAKHAIAIGEKIDYPIGLAYAYRSLGVFQWREQGDLINAEVSYEKALDNARRGDERFTLVNNLIDCASLKIELKKYGEARLLIEESIPICLEAGLEEQLQEAKENLAILNYEEGNYKSAYENLSTAYLLSDTIYNVQLAEKLSDANAKYDLSQKEAEIARQELEITKQKSTRNQILFGGILSLLVATGVYQWYFYRQRKKQSDQLVAFNHKLANAETQALRAQMNPHFIFNALNSIKLYMLNQKPEKGSTYLDSFARLVRSVLQNSKEPLISLEKELEALDLYIGLEKLRFDQAFDHEINVAKDLDASFYEVPPLILQPFVENAIWHGLMPLKRKGKLSIDAWLENEKLFIRIEDNGIGRARSAENKSPDLPYKKSMGMAITKERLALQKDLTGLEIDLHVIDLLDDARVGIGTRVEIAIDYG